MIESLLKKPMHHTYQSEIIIIFYFHTYNDLERRMMMMKSLIAFVRLYFIIIVMHELDYHRSFDRQKKDYLQLRYSKKFLAFMDLNASQGFVIRSKFTNLKVKLFNVFLIHILHTILSRRKETSAITISKVDHLYEFCQNIRISSLNSSDQYYA